MYNNARITIYKASFILSTLGKLLQRGSEQNYQDTRRNLLKIKMVVSINVFGLALQVINMDVLLILCSV
jgi:hypothetical protein